jgi:hypothetical protein
MVETVQPVRKADLMLDPETLKLIEQAETGIETFAYERPDVELPVGKKIRVKLAGTDVARAQIQVLNEGGENNLHFHANVDLIYVVLQGEVHFYGVGDKLLGKFVPWQGLKLPQYSRYWFKSVGKQEAVLLQMSGYPKGAKAKKRIACEPPKGPFESSVL